jgi:RND family efflux transporter MFP subunit
LQSCSFLPSAEKEETNPSTHQTTDHAIITTEVDIQDITKKPFKEKLIVNGTIDPSRAIELKMDRGGLLRMFNLVDGSSVSKGELMAQLEYEELQHDLALLRTDYEQAKLDRDERIMLLGGAFGEDSTITQEQLSYVDTKSGINRITAQIEKNEYQLDKMSLYAPYSGVVADVEVKQHQIISAGEELCRLIDPSSYEAKFQIIETSLSQVQIGQHISFKSAAYPDRRIAAVINKINPSINDNGLITIYARIQGSKKRLYEGMNIQVEILSKTEPLIVIPKDAIVLRSERPVVFTYDADEGRAKWNYVTVAHENDLEAAISEGLNKDDQIIISGHLNLDHDAKVSVINEPNQ